MGKLQITVHTLHIHRRDSILEATSINPVIGVNVHNTSDRIPAVTQKDVNGAYTTFSEVLELEDIQQINRIEISVMNRQKIDEGVDEGATILEKVGYCVVSLRRLFKGQERVKWYTLASPDEKNPGVAGYVQLALYSEDVGASPSSDYQVAETQVANILADEKQDSFYSPKLTRFLLINDPLNLHMADVILSEGHCEEETGYDSDDESLDGDNLPRESPKENYIRQLAMYGVEESPALSIAVSIQGANDLPCKENDNINPFIVLTTDTQEHTTKHASMTTNPSFGNVEDTLFDVTQGPQSEVQIAVYHRDNDRDYLLALTCVTFESIMSRHTCTRTYPLLTPSKEYGGTVTLHWYTEDFGPEVCPEEQQCINAFYTRLTNFFRRYDPSRLAAVDTIATEYYNTDVCGKVMAALVDEYGLEPGSGIFELSFHYIDRLVYKGVAVKNANIFAQVSMPLTDFETNVIEYSCRRGHFGSCTFELDAVRETDVVVISIIDDDDNSRIYGTVHVSLASLRRGYQKYRSLAIVSYPGTSEARISGGLYISLFSTCLGQETDVDEVCEKFYAKKLRQILPFKCPMLLHRIDVITCTTYDMEEYLNKVDKLTEINNYYSGKLLAITDSSMKGQEQMKKGANNSSNVSREPGRLFVRVMSINGLKSDEVHPETSVGFEEQEGPMVRAENLCFPPHCHKYVVEDPANDVLCVNIVAENGANHGRCVIPICNFPQNEYFERTYPLTHVPKYPNEPFDEGNVTIAVVIEGNCGTNGGKGECFMFADEDAPLCDPKVELICDKNDKHEADKHEADEETAAITLTNGSCERDHESGIVFQDSVVADDSVIEEQHIESGEMFTVTLVSAQSLKRDGKIETHANVYAKLKIRDTKHRTPTVESHGKEVLFASRFEFEVLQASHDDALLISIYNSEIGGDYRYGTAEIDFTRLNLGVTRETTVPIVTFPGTADSAISGYITVRMKSKTYGQRDNQKPLTTQQMTRLRNFYIKNCPEKLCRLDFEYDPKNQDGIDILMENNVKHYAPEPLSLDLQVTVVKGNDLDNPTAALEGSGYSGGGYDVIVKIGKDSEQTKTIISSHPIYNATFDFEVNSKDEVMTIIMMNGQKEYGRCLASLKNIPQNQSKTRTVALVSMAGTKKAFNRGSVTLTFFTNAFGSKKVPSEEAEASHRNRITALLKRYAPEELHRVEVMLGDNVGKEATLLSNLIEKYGCVPGDARLAVTIKEVFNLSRNGNEVEKGMPFVKIKSSMEKCCTKAVRYSKQAIYDETFTFDLAKPENDVLRVSVVNDEFAKGYQYGEVLISLARLQKGVSRQMTVMFIQHAGTKKAIFGGYITLIIRSDDFGSDYPIDIQEEIHWYNRLKAFFQLYAPEKIHAIDVVCSALQSDKEGYMKQLVAKYGPEQVVHQATVTVVQCANLQINKRDIMVGLTIGRDYMTTHTARPVENVFHFNEKFKNVVINDPEEAELVLIVLNNDDKTEIGRANISFSGMFKCEEKMVRLCLVGNAGTNKAYINGTIIVKIKPNNFGYVRNQYDAPVVDQNLYDEARSLLETHLVRENPADLHKMEVILGSHIGRMSNFIVELKSKNTAKKPYSPLTVYLRNIQSSVVGTVSIICEIGGTTFFETNPVKIDYENSVVHFTSHYAATTEQEIDPSQGEIQFSLVFHSGHRTEVMSIAKLKLRHCVRDIFNFRRLKFFGIKYGDEIATLCVDLRSVDFLLSPRQTSNVNIKEFSEKVWKTVEKDAISVLHRYNIEALRNLDNISRSSDDIECIHDALLKKYNPKACLTLYLENVIFLTNSSNAMSIAHSAKTWIKANCGIVSDKSSMRISNIGDSESDDVDYTLTTTLRGTTLFNDNEDYGAQGILSTQYSIQARMLRLDLTEEELKRPVLNIQLIGDDEEVWGSVNLSLSALFASLVEPYTQQMVPIIGELPKLSGILTKSNGSVNGPTILGKLSFSFGYPYHQKNPKYLYSRDGEPPYSVTDGPSLSRINYYYNRILLYLLKHNPSQARDHHLEFFEKMLQSGARWHDECVKMLNDHIRRVGKEEGQVSLTPRK